MFLLTKMLDRISNQYKDGFLIYLKNNDLDSFNKLNKFENEIDVLIQSGATTSTSLIQALENYEVLFIEKLSAYKQI